MSEVDKEPRPPLVGVLLAFLGVYLIWGSTYLAILFSLETMPPFLMAGVRFFVAGWILYGICRLRRTEPPSTNQWRTGFVIGGLLLLGGNGAVVWAEQRISSSLAALLVSSVPFWMALIDWIRPGGRAPKGKVILGILFGFAGVAALIGPSRLDEHPQIDLLGALAVLAGAASWATGSIYSKSAVQHRSPLLATSLQMIGGGTLLLALGTALGEWSDLEISSISSISLGALIYLIVFGSIVAFSCYIWLLRVSTPSRVGTYAYVNPVIAVLLGASLANEPVTTRMIWSTVIIIGSVILISMAKTAADPSPKPTR